jgi:predicted SnoaL-like aldol condensation-catalyzing enzyme
MTAKERANLDMVLDWWRVVVEGGHLNLTGNYQAVDYIQHNPQVPQGRDGFKQFMSRVPGRTPQPIKAEWVRPPSLTLVSAPTSCSCSTVSTKIRTMRRRNTSGTTST